MTPEEPKFEPKEPDKPKLKIIYYPDMRLVSKNEPVEEYIKEMAEKTEEMFEAMYAVKGLGLAACQVGWNIKLFIMDVNGQKKVYYNPTIELGGDTIKEPEACLSLPGIVGKIIRNTMVKLTANTPDGAVEETFEGLQARAVQHEMDHLDGSLILERMTPADYGRNKIAINRLKRFAKWRVEQAKQ